MSRTQFDLEQEIMTCWNVTSDLDTLFEELVEGTPSQDTAANIVLGLSQLYEIKFNKLFRTFEDFLKEYYRMRDELRRAKEDLTHMQAELEEFQDAKYSSDEALELVEDEGSEF